jgi:hypothetical protein
VARIHEEDVQKAEDELYDKLHKLFSIEEQSGEPLAIRLAALAARSICEAVRFHAVMTAWAIQEQRDSDGG